MRRSRFQRLANWGLASVLALGICFPVIWWAKPERTAVAFPQSVQPLGYAFPRSAPGWSVTDVPLGDTELVRTMVKRRLNYTEYVFRRYDRGEVDFDVYVARWDPGALPVWQVAAHTPDDCWASSGWACGAMKFKQVLTVDGRDLQPAEWRLFVPISGRARHVWYWHLVDGIPYDFGNRIKDIPDPFRRIRDLLKEMRRGDPAQAFIRITATTDLMEIQGEPVFREVVARLGEMGLYR